MIVLSIIMLFQISCTSLPQSSSLIISCDYDRKKDRTDYMVFPYGEVSMAGKWDKTSYNSISKQQFFVNSDSVIIAISFGLCNKFEFNADNSKEGFDFIEAFYEWESNYFVDKYGLKSRIIEKDTTNNFILWNLFGDNYDTYFLFGEKNCTISNFSINATEKWDEKDKVQFLKNLYLKD